MALAIGEAHGFDGGEAVKRPGETYGRVLAAGKQNERGFGAQSHRGDQAQSTMRPRECASAAISRISASVRAKSKIAIFSASRSTLLVRGIAPMPCWISQRSD